MEDSYRYYHVDILDVRFKSMSNRKECDSTYLSLLHVLCHGDAVLIELECH